MTLLYGANVLPILTNSEFKSYLSTCVPEILNMFFADSKLDLSGLPLSSVFEKNKLPVMGSKYPEVFFRSAIFSTCSLSALSNPDALPDWI